MDDKIKIIRLEETDSTNVYLHNYRGEEGGLMTVVTTLFQKAGKGQGTNSWESERGKNLLMSIKIHPKILPIDRQYVLQEAMALAIRDVIAGYVDDVTIKWPNDIYVGNKKICGTLSECSFYGSFIDDCILGSGINVNQEVFVSDAPNPISLRLITGECYDLDAILDAIIERLEKYIETINSGDYDSIYSLYYRSLFRRQGFNSYSDEKGDFMARIVEVQPNGYLVLERNDGTRQSYAFKEVRMNWATMSTAPSMPVSDELTTRS